jgi:hypothetical protein
MKKLYIALTRSKEELILVIDEELANSFTKDEIEKNFSNLGVPYYSSHYVSG